MRRHWVNCGPKALQQRALRRSTAQAGAKWCQVALGACSAVTLASAGTLDCPLEQRIPDCSGPAHGSAYIDALVQNGYNRHVRPSCSNGTHRGPTIVEVQLRLTHLSLIDVKKGRATIQGYLRSWWQDPRLAFTSSDDGGCFDTIDLMEDQADLVWKPDLYVDNLASGDDYTETTASELTQISSDGTVWHSKQILITTACMINLRYLPYDRHECGMVLASYSQGVKNIRLVPRGGVLGYGYSGVGVIATDFSGAVWHPPKGFLEADLASQGLIELSGGWDYATLSWQFERNPGYYETAFILPSQFILLLSYMQFYIDRVAAPARAGFATMPVLIMMSLTQMLYRSLPEGAQRMWLSDFLVAIMIVCVAEALEFGLVQTYQVQERNRAANLRGLQKVRETALRLILEAKCEGISLLELLELHQAKQVQLGENALAKERGSRRESLKRTRGWLEGADKLPVDIAKSSARLAAWRPSIPGQPEGEEGAGMLATCKVESAPLSLPDVQQQAPIEGTPSGTMYDRMAQSGDAKRNNIREADLICLLYAKRVFQYFDQRDVNDNEMYASSFRRSLRSFDIYISDDHAARIMGMFLRDRGKTTGMDMKKEFLRFSEFTELLLQVEEYVLHPNSVFDFGVMASLAWHEMPPSACVDVFARFFFFFVIVILDISFLANAGGE